MPCHRTKLGGGNSNIFDFYPDPWGNDPIWRAYFSKGLTDGQSLAPHLEAPKTDTKRPTNAVNFETFYTKCVFIYIQYRHLWHNDKFKLLNLQPCFFFVMFLFSFMALMVFSPLRFLHGFDPPKNKGRYRDSLVAAHAAMVDNPQLGFSW